MKYLTAAEAAYLLRVTPAAVRAMCRSGRLPAVRIPGAGGRGRYRIAADDLQLVLEPARPPRVSSPAGGCTRRDRPSDRGGDEV